MEMSLDESEREMELWKDNQFADWNGMVDGFVSKGKAKEFLEESGRRNLDK